MNFETLFSIAMLGAFIWAVRFLLPKALKERNALALTSAVLTALFALLLWLLIGVGTRSSL
jgi:hypothetical protein